jgi:hypothetical protein
MREETYTTHNSRIIGDLRGIVLFRSRRLLDSQILDIATTEYDILVDIV